MHDDVRGIIRQEVMLLPAKQQMALSLRIFDDLSFKEIAAIMKCPYDTAKANYRHALMKLRNRFKENQSLQKLSDFEQVFQPEMRGCVAEVET